MYKYFYKYIFHVFKCRKIISKTIMFKDKNKIRNSNFVRSQK